MLASFFLPFRFIAHQSKPINIFESDVGKSRLIFSLF